MSQLLALQQVPLWLAAAATLAHQELLCFGQHSFKAIAVSSLGRCCCTRKHALPAVRAASSLLPTVFEFIKVHACV
jgi:hypothetical protein